MHQALFLALYTFKKSTLLFCLCICFFTITNAQTFTKIPNNTKRIVFLGNSITYQGQYISFLETIFTLENPTQKIEFINVGLPSETVSGLSEINHAKGKFPRPDLHERLKRILEKTKPDFIFVSYGINDGIYMPFNEKRFQKFKKGMFWLNKEIKKRNIPNVYLTPTPYDKPNDEAYSNVIDIYTNWLVSLKYTDGWDVINIHEDLKNKLLNKKEVDPNFMFTHDGIHPKEEGHWLMAKKILQSLGISKVENANTIHEAAELYTKGKKIYQLVELRQKIMKNAWLTYTGHKRPNMKEGISLKKAKEKYRQIQSEIDVILKSQKR